VVAVAERNKSVLFRASGPGCVVLTPRAPYSASVAQKREEPHSGNERADLNRVLQPQLKSSRKHPESDSKYRPSKGPVGSTLIVVQSLSRRQSRR